MQIIVTGATGTLGKAVIAALTAAGHQTISLVRTPDTGAQEEVTQVAVHDLSDPQATREAFSHAHAALGRIDAVIHLAGAFKWVQVADSTTEDWWNLYAINVGTTVNVVHAALPLLPDGASIVCVGAASAQPAKAGMAPYGAAKSGVARIVEALSEELRPRHIRINGVAPAIINTPRNRADMTDADPAEWTSPQAIADVILFLIDPQSRAINGAVIPVTNNA